MKTGLILNSLLVEKYLVKEKNGTRILDRLCKEDFHLKLGRSSKKTIHDALILIARRISHSIEIMTVAHSNFVIPNLRRQTSIV